METWKDVPAFEGFYQISDSGRVRSVTRNLCWDNHGKKVCRDLEGQLIKQHPHVGMKGTRYLVVWLRRPGFRRKYFVHRLVASAFMPNPADLPIVNHMDGDKNNNRLLNLEWVSGSENNNHYIRGRRKAEEEVF